MVYGNFIMINVWQSFKLDEIKVSPPAKGCGFATTDSQEQV